MDPTTDVSKARRLGGFTFTIQWHLTAKCDQNCSHCYIGKKDEEYRDEIKNELPTESCFHVLDDIEATFANWHVPVRINFTGGDPLLKDGFFDVLRYAQAKGFSLGILGNPNNLDHGVARTLKELGVDTYQLSLDGSEDTHDKLRRRDGLYRDTLRAAHVLRDVGIRSVIMYTLHKLNAPDLIKIIGIVAEEELDVFDFARLVPIGNARDLREFILAPNEYRDLLLAVFEEYRRLQTKGVRTRFGRKDHLWNLLYQELGILRLPANPGKKIIAGCSVGWQQLAILSNGKVLGCRRLPIVLGTVPAQSLGNIFIQSSELNVLRDVQRLEKCRTCELIFICRGCPAVAYGATGDPFAPDPQCWKNAVQ